MKSQSGDKLPLIDESFYSLGFRSFVFEVVVAAFAGC